MQGKQFLATALVYMDLSRHEDGSEKVGEVEEGEEDLLNLLSTEDSNLQGCGEIIQGVTCLKREGKNPSD